MFSYDMWIGFAKETDLTELNWADGFPEFILKKAHINVEIVIITVPLLTKWYK